MYHGDVVSAFEKVRLNMIHFSIIMIPILLLFFTGLASAGTVQCGDQTWTTDGAADQKEINEAIREGDTVYLSGDFCINDPIILDSDTVLDGQGQTTITLPDNANRLSGSEYKHAATKGYAKTMIPMIRANNCKNIEIIGIHFDGNAGGQPDLITGRGFYNFIMPTGCDGISVHDCSGENSLGDFLRPIKCTNIKFYNIEAKRLGHEALFAIRSSNIEMYGCKIDCRINNACRIMGSNNAYMHDNYVTCTAKESAGPGMQVDVIENQEMNVEICNNVFVSTGGPGLWIVGDHNNYEKSKTSIKIHHNAFLSTGWDGRDWQGGVLTSVVHNVNIYNNVFDGCSNAGVVTYKVKGLPTGQTGADFDITVKDNIITNSKKGRNTGSGVGYGLSNTLSHSHNIISSGNVLWENAGGNYNKCSGNDLVQDPKLDPASTGWRWTGSGWECDYVSADVNVWDSEEKVDEEIEEEDYEPVPEREFDSLFSIFTMDFLEIAGDSNAIYSGGAHIQSPTEAVGTVTQYIRGTNVSTYVDVPTTGLTSIHYKCGELETIHTRMLGERHGFNTIYSNVSIWNGDIPHSGSSLYLEGNIDSADIEVTCYTVSGSFKPELEIQTIVQKEIRFFDPRFKFVFAILLVCFLYCRFVIKHTF